MARIKLSGIQIPTPSKLNIDGELTLDAQAGTSGQILTSAGAGATPTWTTISSYTLPAATSTALGGIELFDNATQTTVANAVTTTASRTYGLQLNAAGQAVVNVPWADTNTNTTYTFDTGTTNGTFNVTPSDSTAFAVSIFGLGTAAYTASSAYATSGHAHGNISNTGTTATTVTATNPLKVVIADSGGAVGLLSTTSASATTFLRGDGTWVTPTDNNWYPTTFAYTGGTTAGPTGSLTGSGMSAVSFGAIPSAGASASGIVTTGSQTFAGTKTFSSSIDTPGIARSGTSALALSTAAAATSTGAISITSGNVTSAGTSGTVSIDVGSSVGGGGPGSVTIGTINASAITIGKTGLNISTPGGIDATQTVTGGNLTTGGTLTRTTLVGGGTTTASINTSGQFIRTTSSARYKQDISAATYDYQDILSLEPKTFRLKDEVEENSDSRTYAGFVAEDVHEIDSLKVFVNYLTQEDGSKIPDGIAYGEMVSALVSAIKHQDTLIKSLETRLEALENN